MKTSIRYLFITVFTCNTQVSNTFYLPTDDTIQQDMSTIENERQHVSYYQWVPFILMFEAALAFTPCLLWRFLHRRSGINLATIMDAARVCSGATYVEIREKAIRHIVNQLDRYMLAQRDYRTGCYVRVPRINTYYNCYLRDTITWKCCLLN